MTVPFAIARFLKAPSVGARTPHLLGAAFVASVLLLAAIAGLHFEQRRATDIFAAGAADLRAARLALLQGFERVPPGGAAGDAVQRRAIAAELDGVLVALERAADFAARTGLTGTSLPAALAAFRSCLTEWTSTADIDRPGAALRFAFHRLEREAARVDSDLGELSASIRRAQDRTFAWSVGTGAALLSFLCLGAGVASRARERAIARAEQRGLAVAERLAISEELLRRATDELDSARQVLAERAGELAALSVDLRARTDEAEAARRARATLLANVAGALRAPLDAIADLGRLAREAADPDSRRDIAGRIGEASAELLALADAMHDMARIEIGELHLARRRFPLGRVLDDLRRRIAPMADARRLELGWEIAPGACVDVEGDEMRLTQAIWNLLVNAVDFTERGRVVLSVSAEPASESTVSLRIEIRDSGMGIAPEMHGRIFEPFVRGDGKRVRSPRAGIGLGLPIARHLARRMGGEVEARSLPGLGSTFALTVRLYRMPDPTGRHDTPQRSSAGATIRACGPATEIDAHAPLLPQGARILIVDDSDVNREVLAELLARAEVDVAVAENGRETVRMAQHARYDLVLMDVQMPEMDGLEATRRIRSLPGWADIPIVAVTTHVYPEDRARCLAAGMNDHLAKPVEPAALFGALARWLDRPESAAILSKEDPVDTLDTRTTVETELGRIPGLVVDDGIRHVGGDAARLRRFLLRFSQEHADAAHRLRDFAATGDRPAAARLAHTVKGLCATLGLSTLSNAACALERALLPDGSGAISADLARFEAALDETCEAIRALGPPPGDTNVSSLPRSALATR
jgi:signal transduction histidine kinase/DNA-binding response OmpR family regulator